MSDEAFEQRIVDARSESTGATMRRIGCITSLVVLFLHNQAHGQSPHRFSPDAIRLLEQTTQGYDLNGKRMPAGAFDEAVLSGLETSDDPNVRELARMMPGLKLLQALGRQQGGAARQAIVNRAKDLPGIMAGQVIAAMASPEKDQDDIRSAAKMLEAMMGSEPQKEVNKAWSMTLLGNGLAMALKQGLANLANAGTTGQAKPLVIDVRVGTEAGRLGTISVTNRSKQALNHCLIITRLEPDTERIGQMAGQEDAVGAIILPAMGLSRGTVEGSREAARLRYLFLQQDKGVVAYVPEIPAGGTVTTTLAAPSYYSVSRNAEISLWSDEGAAEHRAASNWAAARKPVAAGPASTRARPVAPGRSLNPRDPAPPARQGMPARNSTGAGPFGVGSVWRGTSHVGPTGGKQVTQRIQLTITERDGDNFKGRLLYNEGSPARIEGTISGDNVDWQIRVGGQPGLPHSGKVTRSRMDVTYSGPGSGDTAVEGTMVLTHAANPRR